MQCEYESAIPAIGESEIKMGVSHKPLPYVAALNKLLSTNAA